MSTATSQNAEQQDKEQQAYSFILLLDGVERFDDPTANALFEAGCDDALFGMMNGQAYLEFDRDADSPLEAITSAIEAVESCGRGIRVRQVVPPGEEAIGLVNAWLRLRSKVKDSSGMDLSNLLRSSAE